MASMHTWAEFREIINQVIDQAEARECPACRLLRLRLSPEPKTSLAELLEAAEQRARERSQVDIPA